jgi:hypothetical protein
MDVEINSVTHCLWLRGASNKKIKSQIKETYGDGVIHLRSVQRWTHDFAARRTELHPLPSRGRPIDPEKADRIRGPPESEHYLSQKTLPRRLNIRHDRVHRILAEELGL